MDHESLQILVIDPQAERAQEINSLIRNSGINVHISHADDGVHMERLLREKKPALCLLHPSAVPAIELQRICDATAHHGALLAVSCTPQDMELFRKVLEERACIGVNADDPSQLVTLVRHLVRNSQTGRELARLETQMEELQSLYELLLRSTGDAIAYVHEGLHIAANAPYRAALGIRDESELASLSLLELMHAPDHDIKSLIRDFGQGQFPAESLTVQVKPPLGEPFAASVHFSPAQYEGEACVQIKLQLLDAEGQPAGAPFQAGADRDALTGTMERAAFIEAVQQRLAADHERPAAMYYLQPDNGGQLVHRLTPAAFDNYVRALARAMKDRLTADDLLCRFGDCTFALLALRDDREQLLSLGETLRDDVAAQVHLAGTANLPHGASLGLVVLGGHDRDAMLVLDQARGAWEQAAAEGNSVQLYRPARNDGGEQGDDDDWAERLRYALNNDDFYSVQQAIVNLEGDGEGLFENRTWLHEDDDEHPMETFMAAAERYELASTIDRQVIPALLETISGSGDRHILNISANSVQDFSFPGWFQRQLQSHDVEGRQVVLQMSAEAALHDLRATHRLIEEISPTGCTFSVSGVHAGRQHESLPSQLDLAFIKLDSQLTRDLKDHPEVLPSVRNLVSIAAAAGTHVLADQVNNSVDMATLWQCGIKHLAGDFLQESSRSIG